MCLALFLLLIAENFGILSTFSGVIVDKFCGKTLYSLLEPVTSRITSHYMLIQEEVQTMN